MINLLKKHFATLPHVTWTLFSEPIEVSRSQLAAMRNLKTGSGLKKNCLADNFRWIAVPFCIFWMILKNCVREKSG